MRCAARSVSWIELRCVLLGVLSCAALSMPALPAQDSGDDEDDRPVRSIATCRKIDVEAVQIEARVGPRTVELVGLAESKWIEHRPTTVGALADQVRVTILGRRHSSQRTPEGQNIPPSIAQVSAVVVGEFDPPKLTEKQTAAKLEWIRGVLRPAPGMRYTLDHVVLQVGSDRMALQMVPYRWPAVTEGSPARLRKGTTLRIEGEVVRPPERPEGEEKRKRKEPPPRIRIERAEILAPRFPKKDYEFILGTGSP